VAGNSWGKVRTLQDFAGRPIKEAGPSTPATVTGFKEVPEFGDRFEVAKSEKAARMFTAEHHAKANREAASTNITSTDLLNMISKKHETQEVNVIVKADVQGSLTSITDSLRLLENEELNVRIIGSGIGNISENDVRTAATTGAIIYGFHVQLPPAVKQLAAREKVSVRIFKVIYELLDDAKVALEDLLSPEVVETEVGKLLIKGVFRTTKEEIICGGEVTAGKATPGILARVIRNNENLAEVEVTHVQRQQQEAKEVFEGEMCGLQLKTRGKLLIEVGDRLEFFSRELVKRKL
jgi:translation initiation factor IF-2